MFITRVGEWYNLRLEPVEFGVMLRGSSKDGRHDTSLLRLDDEELQKLADAIEEYFAALRL